MLFNSVAFAVFLCVVLALYYPLGRRVQNAWLLCASWFFYGCWDPRFLSLILVSTLVDYGCGRAMGSASDRRRRLLLYLSLAVNLGILGCFKYANFFVQSACVALRSLGWQCNEHVLQIVLPVGISFYTFQTLSYTIDVYRRRIEPTRDLLSFAVFVAYFPQLVAGPIERASRLLPQFERPRVVGWNDLRHGCLLILVGWFRKVAIADALAPMVDVRFAEPTRCSGADLLLALYLFALQIYCDFAGYSDMARGTSKLLGIELSVNFRRPYFAHNITAFWRRWHISLSSWLRDYLYIPLGGNRHGVLAMYRNLMLTMLLGGLWHGAGWTFVVWGGLHGLYLTAHKAMTRSIQPRPHRWHWLTGVLTFHLVCLAWVFFRSPEFGHALAYLDAIYHWNAPAGVMPMAWADPRLLVLLGLLLVVDLLQDVAGEPRPILALPWPVRGLLYAALIIATLALGGIDADVPFIYFQF